MEGLLLQLEVGTVVRMTERMDETVRVKFKALVIACLLGPRS